MEHQYGWAFTRTVSHLRSSKELLLTPVVVSRNEKEKVLIEGSINSIRVSIAIKQVRKLVWFNCPAPLYFERNHVHQNNPIRSLLECHMTSCLSCRLGLLLQYQPRSRFLKHRKRWGRGNAGVANESLVSTVRACAKYSWNFKRPLYFQQTAVLFLCHHRLFIAGRTLGLAIDLYGLAVSSVTEVAPLCLNSSKSLTAFFKSSTWLQHFILHKCCGSLSTVVSRSNLLPTIETLLLDELLSWQRLHKKFKQRGWWTHPMLR